MDRYTTPCKVQILARSFLERNERMNNYIINPMWFYWLDLLSDLECAICVITGVIGVCIFIILVISSTKIFDGWNDEEKALGKKMAKKAIKLSIIPICMIFIIVLIPSKETMYQMMIAKYITHENINLSVEAVKSAVDYIVQAFKGM